MGRQEAPAGLTSQAHSPIGDHSPDEGHQHGVWDALQRCRESKGEGIKEHQALLLPEDRQSLHLKIITVECVSMLKELSMQHFLFYVDYFSFM